MSEIEYQLKFPILERTFNEKDLTFSINHIKSRLGSVLYFKFITYDYNQDVIETYTSQRWYIDTVYSRRVQSFSISDESYNNTYYYRIILVLIGNDSENPLYFTECMLNEGRDLGIYHKPFEEVVKEVGLFNSRYANLYFDDGNYLQVIRPQGESFMTNRITKSTCTVLAPHLAHESDMDDPVNIFLEFLHQREQRIDALR